MKIQFNYKEFLFGALAFFLMVPFFKPNYIAVKMPALNTVFLYYLYGAIGFIFLYYISILIINKRAPSAIVVIISFYAAALVLSSFLNGGAIMASLLEGISYMALFMLSELLLTRSLNMFLNVITPILNFLIIINFVSLLVWPTGMYRSYVVSGEFWNSGNNWILGYDNAFFAYVLPAALFSFVKYLYVDKSLMAKIKLIVMTVICGYTIISRWVATAVVCIVLFFILAFLIVINKLPKVANARTYFLGNVGVFFAIVVFRIQEIFSFLIKDILEKDITFSGRTGVWDLSIKSFYEAPIFGYGIEAVTETIGRISINSSHNQYLWVLYRGGLAYFTPFIIMIMAVVKRLYDNRHIPYVRITAAALCAMFILWEIEAISTNSIMIMFVFGYCVGHAPLKNREETYETSNKKSKIIFKTKKVGAL